jgi:CO/xanthine dehydrogenase FAD-binding subunit
METFEYYEPKTVSETTQLLSDYGGRAVVLAGGVDLIPSMRKEEFKAKCVVNIQKVAGLARIDFDDSAGLRFGAMATLRALETSRDVQQYYPAFYAALHQITSVQAKCMGTAVGNICVGTPGSDVATVLLALGARLTIAGPAGERVEPMEHFYMGKRRTSLQTGEMVVGVCLPFPPQGTVSAFINLVRVHADVAKLTTAVTITIGSGVCKDARIALGAAAPTVFRARKAEAALLGRALTAEAINDAAHIAAGETNPSSGIRSTAEYRKDAVVVLVRRAIEKALAVGKVKNEEEER